MATFSEKNTHLFEGDKTDADVEYLKRLYDVAVPKIAHLNSPEGFEVTAIYKPQDLLGDGDKNGRIGTVGKTAAYVRRLADDNVFFIEEFTHGDWASLTAMTSEDVFKAMQGSQMDSQLGFALGVDTASLSSKQKVAINPNAGIYKGTRISLHCYRGIEKSPESLGGVVPNGYGKSGGHLDVAKGIKTEKQVVCSVAFLFNEDGLEEFGLGSNAQRIEDALLYASIKQYEKAHNIASQPQKEKLSSVGVDFNKYNENQLNYIAAADTNDKMKYRSQFVDALLDLLGVENGKVKNVDKALDVLIDRSSNNYFNRTLQAVDKGDSFIPHLVESMGVPNISKKEMRRACEILWDNTRQSKSMNLSRFRLDTKRVFAIVKLPEEWFKRSDGESVLAPRSIFSDKEYSDKVADKVMSYAERLGLALDTMKGNNDKQGMKDVIKSWKWLNNKNGFDNNVNALDKKFKAEATVEDYNNMLEQMIRSVNLGALSRCDHITDDAVEIDGQNNAVDIIGDNVMQQHASYAHDKELEYLQDRYDAWECKTELVTLFDGEIAIDVDGDEYLISSLSDIDDGLEIDDDIDKDQIKSGTELAFVVNKEGENIGLLIGKLNAGKLTIFDEAGFDITLPEKVINELVTKLNVPGVITREREIKINAQQDDLAYGPEDGFDIELFGGEEKYFAADAYDIDSAILSSKKATSVSDMFQLNAELHKTYGGIVQDANLSEKNNFSWEGLFDGEIELEDELGDAYTLSTITDRLSLLDEGAMQNHCVFSYLSACMSGEAIILTLKDDEGLTAATIELKMKEEGLSVAQCYGYSNNNVDISVNNMVEAFVKEINSDLDGNKYGISSDDFQRISEQEVDGDAIDLAHRQPLKEGGVFLAFPYAGNGVYVAALALEEYTPAGVDMDRIAEQNMVYNDIYYTSEIPKALGQIKTLAKEQNISPLDVARMACAHDLEPGTRELELAVERDVGVYNLIKEVRGEFLSPDAPTKLTPAQLGMEINNRLNAEFGVKLFQPEKMAQGHQPIMSVTQSLQTEEKRVADETNPHLVAKANTMAQRELTHGRR